ncbi:hypothetical protein MASR2M78_02200 [Treponema sp.]
MKRLLFVPVLFCVLSLGLSAEDIAVVASEEAERLDFTATVNAGYDGSSWMTKEEGRLEYNSGPFTLIADLYISNDQKYLPNEALLSSGTFLNNYFIMQEGALSYTLGNLSLSGGRLRNYDIVDSPYSLFINSLGHTSSGMNLRYETDHFIYQTKWIELNSRNAVSTPAWDKYHAYMNSGSLGMPDRGANYKIYALKYNDMRFGFLDAAVYTGRSFDAEYFLNPIPQYFIQYVKGEHGRPWSTDSNENDIIGLFWDIKKPGLWDAYTQFLMDDFSMYAILGDKTVNNPWKAAWAMGGSLATRYGTIGFHHGGALRYTFEPITSERDSDGNHLKSDIARTAYGYSYYPETRYNENTGSDLREIPIAENALGYKYGENNLAFQVDYENKIRDFSLGAEFEYVLAGNNSPANPWSDYKRWELDGSKLFNDKQIEQRIELRLKAARRFGPWLFSAATGIGGRFNKLTLQKPDAESDWSVADTDIYIWKTSGENELLISATLGASYTFGMLPFKK